MMRFEMVVALFPDLAAPELADWIARGSMTVDSVRRRMPVSADAWLAGSVNASITLPRAVQYAGSRPPTRVGSETRVVVTRSR